MCTGVVLLLTLDALGTSWKVIFVHRRNIPTLFGVFLEHVARQFLCTVAVLLLVLGCFWDIFGVYSCAQAQYSGAVRGVSGTTWKLFLCTWLTL